MKSYSFCVFYSALVIVVCWTERCQQLPIKNPSIICADGSRSLDESWASGPEDNRGGKLLDHNVELGTFLSSPAWQIGNIVTLGGASITMLYCYGRWAL